MRSGRRTAAGWTVVVVAGLLGGAAGCRGPGAPSVPRPPAGASPAAADRQVASPADLPPIASLRQLPQDHDYQRVLRGFMAGLTEQDFAHGVTNGLACPPGSADPDVQYRAYIYTQLPQPLVGSKRGVPSINAPARLFTLGSIETTNGVMRVPVYPEALTSLLRWDYEGNRFRNSRALKLRAFVAAAVNLVMLDAHIDREPTVRRSDRMGYQLVVSAAAYPGFRDVLPAAVQAAYEEGLKRLSRRLIEWGPKGEEPNLDVTAAVGLWWAGEVCRDAQLRQEAEAYARAMLSPPRFHPAGYCVERGGLDIGFQGMANFFLTGLALASDWPFAREAVERAYRLRSLLCLPDPDGRIASPTAFNARTGSGALVDQWDYPSRDLAASMITDEAAWFLRPVSNADLAAAAPARAAEFNRQIGENPRAADRPGFIADEEIRNSPWAFSMWPSWNFPASVNFGYEFYPKGAYVRRAALEKAAPPMLQSPYRRPGTFVANLGDAFVVTKQAGYAAIFHVGPTGTQEPGDGLYQFSSPLGFGGGQLAAFWTPGSGAVILNRRRGQHWERPFDTLDEWRAWPVHAVSGCTTEGAVFSSALIPRPEVTTALGRDGGTVAVRGAIAGHPFGQTNALQGSLAYERVFTCDGTGVKVETRLQADGRDTAAELWETIPVYLLEGQAETNVAAAIAGRIGGAWAPLMPEPAVGVEALRLSRFGRSVLITFDRPRRVRLSPAEWSDTFITRAACRTVLIDLLDGAPALLAGPRTITYRIGPERQ